ncbi:PP2C family serine/threonine-protein phosphatase [Neobacillus cucumis]|uniref:Phosphoserine phosphatase n=1 Tax=Neobacillus cucumis TaxID=1740721 RepID=A0A2N5HH80_9BACI|nr:PP2C family serine/threonine-protein phosphatase [Neobacillus cucumis]PLS04864.1 phosphoserine phosphatase [Neobacillus cucumis]
MLERDFNQHIQAIAYQIPKEGNVLNGDSFFMKITDDYFICAVADGLGSGVHAYHSSNAIRQEVEKNHDQEVEVLIERCNQSLKDKRGATLSILKVHFLQKTFTYSSVGNIQFILSCPSGRFIYPLPVLGYLSGKPQKYRCETFSYEKGAKFILYTDGLTIPGIKSLVSSSSSIEEISNYLEIHAKTGKDDMTYIVGQLF